MKLQSILLIAMVFVFPAFLNAQLMAEKNVFTKADTLRGTITAYRKGWDVIKYDLTVQPDIITKSIEGKNTITYKEDQPVRTMQIDLQQPLIVDSIAGENNNRYSF
ncbi:MAG: M1 family peptidase, partial [Bacteroidota bacterium]|nr:M1 family peptidase [Bacteroidota bacterium]